MTTRITTVDAFTEVPFAGNPAAVCLLDSERDEVWMQQVAREMNLSETAFVRPDERGYRLRWFTPSVEVDLCGHATLAAAHVLWEEGREVADGVIRFETKSGTLTAARHEALIELDFPATRPEPCEAPEGLLEALGSKGRKGVYKSRFDYLVELESADEVRRLAPDLQRLRALRVRGVIVTAPGDGGVDVVSRFFAPGAGVDEDPVTGSAHCAIGPYWADRLGRSTLRCYQASRRGGHLIVHVAGDRVKLRGSAVATVRGELVC
jgi:PhzF family phenazine biosynthesis protein